MFKIKTVTLVIFFIFIWICPTLAAENYNHDEKRKEFIKIVQKKLDEWKKTSYQRHGEPFTIKMARADRSWAAFYIFVEDDYHEYDNEKIVYELIKTRRRIQSSYNKTAKDTDPRFQETKKGNLAWHADLLAFTNKLIKIFEFSIKKIAELSQRLENNTLKTEGGEIAYDILILLANQYVNSECYEELAETKKMVRDLIHQAERENFDKDTIEIELLLIVDKLKAKYEQPAPVNIRCIEFPFPCRFSKKLEMMIKSYFKTDQGQDCNE